MKYTTKTEYGLICMIHMAQQAPEKRFTIKELAAQENYPVPYIEKILQALRHGGLVASYSGHNGGYALAKPPAQITLRHIIDVLEGSTFDIFCNNDVREDIVCNHICMCGAKPIWHRTKEILDRFYDAITLDTLAKSQAEVQHLMPAFK